MAPTHSRLHRTCSMNPICSRRIKSNDKKAVRIGAPSFLPKFQRYVEEFLKMPMSAYHIDGLVCGRCEMRLKDYCKKYALPPPGHDGCPSPVPLYPDVPGPPHDPSHPHVPGHSHVPCHPHVPSYPHVPSHPYEGHVQVWSQNAQDLDELILHDELCEQTPPATYPPPYRPRHAQNSDISLGSENLWAGNSQNHMEVNIEYTPNTQDSVPLSISSSAFTITASDAAEKYSNDFVSNSQASMDVMPP